MFTKIPQKLNMKIALLTCEISLVVFVIILFICNCYPFGDNTFPMFDMKILLFPQELLPLGIEIIIGIKLILTSFIMNLFLQRFFYKEYFTIIGSLSWSFGSYLFTRSMNMMWMDVVILMPIVIWTLENLLTYDKYKVNNHKEIIKISMPYVISIFAICYLNYHMAYQVIIFLALWLIMRFITQKEAFSVYKLLQLVFNTLLGILLDAVFLVPAAAEWANSSALSYDIDEIGFGVSQIFCGLLFLVLAALFFMDSKVSKRERIGMALLLGVLLVSLCFNILNPIWHAGMASSYNNHMSDYQYVISDTSNVIDAIKEEDKTFYRIENLAPRQQNDAMQYNYNGTNNTKLADSILGIKYLIGNESVKVHSDYTKKNVDSKETVYENPYALPLAVGVHEFEAPGDSVMDFNPFKLQEDIYQRVSGIDVSVFKNAIMSGEDYFKDGNKCSKYTVSPTINGELYMYIEGISEYTQGLAIEVNGEFKSSYGNSSSMQILNLGTFKAKDTVTVDVIGDSKDSIPGNPIFVTEDVNAIEDAYRNMKSMFAKVERVSSSHIMITAPNCTGLFLTIPYEEGWTVNVDGIITPVQKVYNALMYIPINSTADVHYIDLQYSPVGFNLGLILSVISLGIILILILKNIGVVDENKE